jgi:hypothetical protein
MIKNHIQRIEVLMDRLAAVARDRTTPAPHALQTMQDVVDLLQEQVETLRAATQANAIQRARALGYLADLARKAIETGSLAARLEALEQNMEHRNGKQNG